MHAPSQHHPLPAIGHGDYPGGAHVTASHNPKEYNGFKICRKEAVPLSGKEGLDQILSLIQEDRYLTKSASKGMIIRKDISEDYARHCLSFIDVSKVKSYKVVMDAGNGMAGLTLPPVLQKLPIDVTPLYFELDGSFPNHPASPIELENLVDLQKKMAEAQEELGEKARYPKKLDSWKNFQ